MKKQLALLVVGLVAVLVACGELAHAAAGPGPNDIQDSLPAWSSNGVDLGFERTSTTLQHVLLTTSSGRRTYIASQSGVLRGAVPKSRYWLVQQGSTTLVTTGGRFDRPLAVLQGTDAAGSPDGTRIAYLRGDTLYASALDGAREHELATGIAPPSSDVIGPVWSPNGTQIAIASGTAIQVVAADGSGSRVLTDSGESPSWSANGATIAFERDAQVWVTGADGTGARELADGRLPQFSPVEPTTLAYISDRQHVPGGATRYQYALYLQQVSGVAHKLVDDVHPYSPPRWSPTAALIAVSVGQECRRFGIDVVRSSVGSRAHRVTNRCRFDGTAGADVIHGSQYFDIVNGLGGDDRIDGFDGNDAIYAENGNDTVYGGGGNDFIMGGPGDDRLFGGPGNDVIVGGNGRDHIDCGAGRDVVEGAGPLDRIARNCEIVRR